MLLDLHQRHPAIRSPGNFAARLATAARRRPRHPALLWDGGGLSCRELEARAGGVTRRPARDGVGPGDVVALQLVINPKTAKALGLTLPQSLLSADEVIQ